MGKERKGIAVGLNKGFVTTKINDKKIKKRAVSRKGIRGKRVGTVKSIIQSVCGLAPYEKRIVELLRVGQSKESKKALKIAKSRLGTHSRGKRKRELLDNYIKDQKKKAHDKKEKDL